MKRLMEIQGKSLRFRNFEASLKLKRERSQIHPTCMGLRKEHSLSLENWGAETTEGRSRLHKPRLSTAFSYMISGIPPSAGREVEVRADEI